MTIAIRAPVGKAAANNPDDVAKIERLLKQIGCAPPSGFVIRPPLRISDMTVKAIEDFQKLFGPRFDGVIEPGRTTLRRLNELANPRQLNPISLGLISKGGYLISYRGAPPPKPYRIWLHLGTTAPPPAIAPTLLDTKKCLDVTDRPTADLMCKTNLPALLKLIKDQDLWGKSATCAIGVAKGNHVVSWSNVQTLACPVKPLSGPLRPQIGKGDDGPKLIYTGVQDGRILHHEELNSDHYFKFGGKFETQNAKRGLNCITYVGAVYGVDSSTGAMSSYGTQLADALGATQCNMEGKEKDDIIAFFKKNRSGSYIMWSSTHVVLVVDGTIHEFALSKNGYAETQFDAWNYHGKSYWIRKVTRSFGG